MRKSLLIILLLSSSSCLQDDIDRAVNDCKVYAEEATQGAWEDCTQYFEDEILPQVRSILTEEFQKLLEEVQAQFEETLKNLSEDIMIDLGCWFNTSTGIWNCSGSAICE